MILAEALRALHAAGRIRARLMIGMRVRTNGGSGVVVGADTRPPPDRAGPWLAYPVEPWEDVPLEYQDEVLSFSEDEAEPDLTDPATCGCLLALLREASGDPMLDVARAHGAWWTSSTNEFANNYDGPTDGEAIAAALIALAGAQ